MSKKKTSWIDRYRESSSQGLVTADSNALVNTGVEGLSVRRKPRKVLYHRRRNPLVLASSDSNNNKQQDFTLPPAGTLIKSGSAIHLKELQLTKQVLEHSITLEKQAPSHSVPSQPVVNPSAVRREEYKNNWGLRNSRCEYCQLPGGELECAYCNVIAHPSCYKTELKKHRSTSYQIPRALTVNWLCLDCLSSVNDECVYKAHKKEDIVRGKSQRKGILVIQTFVRMKLAAQRYLRMKRAVIILQTCLRGKAARLRFHRLQRMTLRPYYIHLISVNTPLSSSSSSSFDDLLMIISMVDYKRPRKQFFLFEIPIKDKTKFESPLFVPGIPGTANIVFTLLKKSGPYNYLVGQAIVEMHKTNIFEDGAFKTVTLRPELVSTPLIGNRKPMQIVNEFEYNFAEIQSATTVVFKIRTLNVLSTYCGKVQERVDLNDAIGPERWIVLGNASLRFYRHYGTTSVYKEIFLKDVMQCEIVPCGRGKKKESCIKLSMRQSLMMAPVLIYVPEGAQILRWMSRFEYARKFTPEPIVDNPSLGENEAAVSRRRGSYHVDVACGQFISDFTPKQMSVDEIIPQLAHAVEIDEEKDKDIEDEGIRVKNAGFLKVKDGERFEFK